MGGGSWTEEKFYSYSRSIGRDVSDGRALLRDRKSVV